jgi:hypothetical protein
LYFAFTTGTGAASSGVKALVGEDAGPVAVDRDGAGASGAAVTAAGVAGVSGGTVMPVRDNSVAAAADVFDAGAGGAPSARGSV